MLSAQRPAILVDVSLLMNHIVQSEMQIKLKEHKVITVLELTKVYIFSKRVFLPFVKMVCFARNEKELLLQY